MFCEQRAREKIEKFRKEKSKDWKLVAEFNKLADKWGATEESSAGNELLKGSMQELLEGKLLASSQTNAGQSTLDVVRWLFTETATACSFYRMVDLVEVKQVEHFENEEMRAWVRYQRICQLIPEHDFRQTLERVAGSKIS